MFLIAGADRSLVEVICPTDLFNPFKATVLGRLHAGEEMQEPEVFAKAGLRFPSGERLPQCWSDPSYRSHPPIPSLPAEAHTP